MSGQVREWVRTCLDCQRAKVQRHIRAPVTKFDVPADRFTHINIDLVGPLPASCGFTCLFTVMDRFTRWPEAFPLTSMDANSCASALLRWISRYGVPCDITSDCGTQFMSHVWMALCNLYGSKLHCTTAYHPQANGLVEHFHRHLKFSLKAVPTDKGASWIYHLPWVMLGIRTAPKEDFGTSSAEMVFGRPTAVPDDFVSTIVGASAMPSEHLRRLRETVGQLAPVPTTQHGPVTAYMPATLMRAQHVFIHTGAQGGPLQPLYTDPYS